MTYEAMDIANGLKRILMGIPEIFGIQHEKNISVIRKFNFHGTPKILSEARLLGERGYDISIKFKDDDFLPKTKENEKVCLFLNSLKNYKSDCMPYYFEFDTFSKNSKSDTPAFFLTLSSNPIENIQTFLNLNGENSMAKKFVPLCRSFFPHLIPVNVGFFAGRASTPFRITCKFSTQDFHFRNILINKINKHFEEISFAVLKKLACCNFFYKFAFDFDLLNDGSLGNRFSYEFKLNKKGDAEKKSFLQSNDWKIFCDFMIFLGAADSRIYSLEKCICSTPSKESQSLLCSTSLSHFKISWNNGELEPLKVYVKSKCIDQIQHTK